MNQFHQQKIEQMIAISDNTEEGPVSNELLAVIYSLGRDAQNEEEYAYAMEKLQLFCQCKNATVRTQAILAFSLLAVFHGHLDRTVVESFILQEWIVVLLWQGLQRIRTEKRALCALVSNQRPSGGISI